MLNGSRKLARYRAALACMRPGYFLCESITCLRYASFASILHDPGTTVRGKYHMVYTFSQYHLEIAIACANMSAPQLLDDYDLIRSMLRSRSTSVYSINAFAGR
jgi:hypothetical protein